MINLNRKSLSSLLVIALLALSWSGNIRAADTYPDVQASGEIIELTRKIINVGDLLLELSPTVKVTGNGKTSLKQLGEGDYVGVKLFKFNGRLLVDTIYYFKEDPLANN